MMHALIIDDDKNSLNVLSQMLSFEGISSTTVSRLSTLDHILGALAPIDIVFLDLEMPESDGYKVYTKLRMNPRLEGVPIVACSVHTGAMNTVRDLGFDGFIGKPLDAERFPDQIQQIRSGNSVWQM